LYSRTDFEICEAQFPQNHQPRRKKSLPDDQRAAIRLVRRFTAVSAKCTVNEEESDWKITDRKMARLLVHAVPALSHLPVLNLPVAMFRDVSAWFRLLLGSRLSSWKTTHRRERDGRGDEHFSPRLGELCG
jgi:predicted metal-dependent hydrolase